MFEFFKRLFPDKKEDGFTVDVNTLPLSSGEISSLGGSLSKSKFRVASCQSTGLERSHNEDALFTLDSILYGVEAPVNFGIFLIADGMGGHQSGEVASRLAAQTASQFLLGHVFNEIMYEEKIIQDVDCLSLIGEAVAKAQALIRQRVPGGGTTLTLVLAIDNQLFSAHVGDSRLYLLGLDGKMKLKTKDHTLVKRLVDLGEITEKEAGIHPQRNIIYRALGQTDSLEVDLDQFSIDTGERLLICSDGLWGVLEEHQILDVVQNATNLDQSACDLVRAANDSGGPDNISVILLERMG